MSTIDPEKGMTYSRWLRRAVNDKDLNVQSTPLAWWYRHLAPPEPSTGASLYQREKARHGRVATLSVPVFMLFVFSLFVQAIIDHQYMQVAATIMGLATSVGILYLNRKGFVEVAGILVLLMVYIGSSISMLNYPAGLSLINLSYLYFSIVPAMLALAFFSANSLLIVLPINIVQIWLIVVFGPHDTAITHLLQTMPLKIFFPVYLMQLITSITLYFWARSAEDALRRADRAEEIAAFEMREKEQHTRELEQKRILDAGIQQILQTHIAVANGNLNVRAPLAQDHVLWQLAVALNNLITRLQTLSYREHEIWQQQQQQQKEDERITGHHPKYDKDHITDNRHPKYEPGRATNRKPESAPPPRKQV